MIGIIFGVFSSLVAWYILFHLIKPHIIFEKLISTDSTGRPNGEDYSVVIRNAGLRRAIDLDVIVRIRIPGLSKMSDGIITNIDMEIPGARLVRLSPNYYRRATFDIPFNKFTKAYFPKSIQEKANKKELTLTDIFEINEDTILQIFVFALDQISGSRSLFSTQGLTMQNITNDKKILSSQEFKEFTSSKKDMLYRFLRIYKPPIYLEM